MQRNARPIDWRIRGCSDALDASMSFKGSMQSLSNLIPDQSTMGIWTCRPASIELFDFNSGGGPFSSGFSSGFQVGYASPNTLDAISVMRISGSVLYGMIKQTTGTLAGFDIPFAYNLSTNAAIIVTGTQTTTTLPASQPTTGAWTPPQMDLIGVKMMVAHPGFTGAGGNYVGWFDLTNPLAPVWNAGNLSGGFISFATAPTGVKQFFNRAYYLYNLTGAPAVIFSDALNATHCTNANQILAFGDNTPLTALGQLPLNNVLGGIVQALIVFKGTTNMYQITGDAALGNLYQNSLNVATGTLSPNSICPTPKGLAFLAPDGVRIIDFTGNVQDAIGNQGQGIAVPFIYSAQPTRVFIACNGNLMRISTQNGNISTEPQQDWWYDFNRGIWTGPHTFPAALALPYQQTFIIAPVGVSHQLWQSDFIQYSTSTFVENGNQMTWAAQTTLLPDMDQITNNAMTEGSLDMALPPTNATVAVAFNDQQNSPIAQVGINPAQSTPPALWGSSTWGNFLWGGGPQAAITPYELQWPIPVVFARGSLLATSRSALNFRLSTIHLRIQVLKTLVNTSLAA